MSLAVVGSTSKGSGAARAALALALCLLAASPRADASQAASARAARARATAAPANPTEPEREAALALDRARKATARGDFVSAALEFRRAFRAAPEDERGLRGYVRSVARLGAAPVAIEQYRRRLAARAGDAASRLLLAELLRAEARYNEASDHYEIIRRREPANRLALRGAAAAALSAGDVAAAEQLYQRDRAASAARRLADRATIRLAEGRPEGALLLLDPVNLIESEPEALLARADAQHELQLYEDERLTLDRLLELHEVAAVPALERRARLLLRAGDKDEARRTCERLLAAEAGNPVAALALKTLGASAADARLTSTAAGALADTVKASAPAADPTKADAARPAAPAVAADEIAPAGEDARAAARRYGADLAAGEAALFLDLPAEAAGALRRAAEARPGAARALLALGRARLALRDAEAAPAFAAVTLSDGRRIDALLGLAQAELLRGEPARAVTLYDDILAADPTNFGARRGRIEAISRQGDDERAAALLVRLAQEAPEAGELRTRLRAALAALGRSWRAAEPDKPAIEPLLAPGDSLRIETANADGASRRRAEASVGDDGRLRVPFLPAAIIAECRTAEDVAAEIKRAGARQLAESEVAVRIERLGRAPLVVAGAVYLGGDFQVRARVDLPAALMLAGGATAQAGRNVFVVRDAGGCRASSADGRADAGYDVLRRIETYDRARLQAGEIAGVQGLTGGDLLIVPPQDAALIVGAVARPGFTPVRFAPSLRDAIRGVGGTTAGARRNAARLLRAQPNGKARQQFAIDLDEIENGVVGDVILRPDDIVEIPGAGAKSAGLLLPGRRAFDAGTAP